MRDRLRQGASADAVTAGTEYSALHLACMRGRADAATWLIYDQGVDADAVDADGVSFSSNLDRRLRDPRRISARTVLIALLSPFHRTSYRYALAAAEISADTFAPRVPQGRDRMREDFIRDWMRRHASRRRWFWLHTASYLCPP